MPATKKVGTQLLVSPHVRADVQALALVRQESVAEVYRVALEGGGIPKLKKDHALALIDLDIFLAAIGGNRIEALDVITNKRVPYGMLGDPRVQADIRLSMAGVKVPAEIKA